MNYYEELMTDLELRMWCADRCKDPDGLNLQKMESLYQFVSGHLGAQQGHQRRVPEID